MGACLVGVSGRHSFYCYHSIPSQSLLFTLICPVHSGLTFTAHSVILSSSFIQFYIIKIHHSPFTRNPCVHKDQDLTMRKYDWTEIDKIPTELSAPPTSIHTHNQDKVTSSAHGERSYSVMSVYTMAGKPNMHVPLLPKSLPLVFVTQEFFCFTHVSISRFLTQSLTTSSPFRLSRLPCLSQSPLLQFPPTLFRPFAY